MNAGFVTVLAVCLLSAAGAARADPCADLARRLPNVTPALCRDAALQPSGARSVQGRPLWQRDVLVPPSRGSRRRAAAGCS